MEGKRSSGLFWEEASGWLQWEAGCASCTAPDQAVRILDWEVPGEGKKTGKRGRNELPAWRLPLVPLPRAAGDNLIPAGKALEGRASRADPEGSSHSLSVIPYPVILYP